MAKRFHNSKGNKMTSDKPKVIKIHDEIIDKAPRYSRTMSDIKEDRNCIANLPPEPVQAFIPRADRGSVMNNKVPDLFEAAQDQIRRDTEDIRKIFKPQKI